MRAGVMTMGAGPVQGAEQSAAAGSEQRQGRPDRLRAIAAGRNWRGVLFYGLVAVALLYGWMHRGDVYLAPNEGAGYVLGITGASMMLMLLLYPLRKHAGWMRRLGHVKHWFRMHMMVGVVGPVLILYHCNFQLGSMNGNIALFSMLLVAASGLIGRHLYSRIHYGLYGSKVDLARLGGDATALRESMKNLIESVPGLREMLNNLEKQTLQLPHSMLGSIAHVLTIAVKSRIVSLRAVFRVRRAFNDGGGDAGTRETIRQYLHIYMMTIRRVAGFSFYERLFSLWHVLHLPLFVMLLVSGVVHVLAVHVY